MGSIPSRERGGRERAWRKGVERGRGKRQKGNSQKKSGLGKASRRQYGAERVDFLKGGSWGGAIAPLFPSRSVNRSSSLWPLSLPPSEPWFSTCWIEISLGSFGRTPGKKESEKEKTEGKIISSVGLSQ